MGWFGLVVAMSVTDKMKISECCELVIKKKVSIIARLGDEK